MVSNVELFQISQQWIYLSVPLIEKPILMQLLMHIADHIWLICDIWWFVKQFLNTSFTMPSKDLTMNIIDWKSLAFSKLCKTYVSVCKTYPGCLAYSTGKIWKMKICASFIMSAAFLTNPREPCDRSGGFETRTSSQLDRKTLTYTIYWTPSCCR